MAWEADTLPAGFQMTASARQMLPSGPVEHLVFSDGLASVSVFVDLGRADGGGTAHDDAAATLGTSSAYSTVVRGYRVTAVGEVPPETVRVIAHAMHNAGPDPGVAESASSTTAPSVGVDRGFFPPAISAAPQAAASPVHGFGAATTPGFGPQSRPAAGPGRR